MPRMAPLVIALALLSLPFPTSPVEASTSPGCVLGPGDWSCSFTCNGDSYSDAVAHPGLAGAVLSITCGSTSTSCHAEVTPCTAWVRVTEDEAGTCTLDDLDDPTMWHQRNPQEDAFAWCGSEPRFFPTDCWFPQWAHTYETALVPDRSMAFRSSQVNGAVIVEDTNLFYDCDGDGIPGDYDGDYDAGTGGAFFGLGPWADELDCKYGHNVHGVNVDVFDFVWGGSVEFVTGANDQSGPIIITDPISGWVTACETDGVISPATDSDDCISPVYMGVGAACGAGGDGGFWVLLLAAKLCSGGEVCVDVTNTPTMGSIIAY